MSFLGFGGANAPSSAQKIAAAEQELEMVTDMFNRLSNSCTKKCIPKEYREAELNKGESVCLDRCVSKFFEVNIKVRTAEAAAGRRAYGGLTVAAAGLGADAEHAGGARRPGGRIRRLRTVNMTTACTIYGSDEREGQRTGHGSIVHYAMTCQRLCAATRVLR